MARECPDDGNEKDRKYDAPISLDGVHIVASCSLVIISGDGTEFILSCGVPKLDFYYFLIT